MISRSRIFRFQPLTQPHVEALLQRALSDTERGYGNHTITVDDAALYHLAEIAGGLRARP